VSLNILIVLLRCSINFLYDTVTCPVSCVQGDTDDAAILDTVTCVRWIMSFLHLPKSNVTHISVISDMSDPCVTSNRTVSPGNLCHSSNTSLCHWLCYLPFSLK